MSDLIDVLDVEECPSPLLLKMFGPEPPVVVDPQIPEIVNSPPVQTNACVVERE